MHRPLGTQQRVGQLEQLIGLPAEAVEKLAAEVPQPIRGLHDHALSTAGTESRLSITATALRFEASQLRSIQRWPPHARGRTTAVQATGAERLNDKLRRVEQGVCVRRTDGDGILAGSPRV